jgi:hypothetical protein
LRGRAFGATLNGRVEAIMTAPHPWTPSARIRALLLAAGLCAFALPALAADPSPALPPNTVLPTPAPQGLGTDSPPDHPGPPTPPPQRTEEKSFSKPAYGNDPKTEADCYYVFGELRCDRVPRRDQGPTPK